MWFLSVAIFLIWFARLPKGMVPLLLAISITLGMLHFTFVFVGLTQLDPTVSSIILQFWAPFSALFAAPKLFAVSVLMEEK
jgi:drug/metabolite transporter (DMT)-like permease